MAKTPGRDAVFSLVMRRQRYNCGKCEVRQHAMVVKQSNGEYFMCDEFQQEYMRSQGRTPFKVHLRLNFRDGDKTNFSIDNLFALCPACTANFLRDQQKDFREIALQNRVKLNMGLVVNVKNFLAAKTGAELSTRDTIALIDLVTNNE